MLSSTIAGYDREQGRMRQCVIDEALIIRVGRGSDEKAMKQLYDSTGRAVYAYILATMQNPADTVEIVQETYLCIRRSAHLYVPAGKPLAWILGIARKLANEYFRINGRRRLRVSDWDSDHSFERIGEIADKIILKHALTILRLEERQVLFLHAAAGLRLREISAYISMPISIVAMLYRRAENKLKKRLDGLGVSL